MNKALKKRVMDNLDRWLENILCDSNDCWTYISTSDIVKEFECYDSLVIENKKTPDNFSAEVLKYIVECLIEINNEIFTENNENYTIYYSHFLFSGIHYVASYTKYKGNNVLQINDEYSILSYCNDEEVDTIHTFRYLYNNYKNNRKRNKNGRVL